MTSVPISQRLPARVWWGALIAVTGLAALLRFVQLDTVPDNLFYDAAVRSMSLSLHNFLYGAFDPTAATSIDKPPIDLWLQVITVKLFGLNSITIKLPEAIAGTAAIPLLYDIVRRVADHLSALCAALVLAVLPAAVVTARSDTMDSVMMLLLLAVAWMLVRAVERRQLRWLLIGAVILGIDFNVKLFEALVPVPAFLVFLWLCWRGEGLGARLRRLAIAGGAFSAVALSWLVLVLLTPAHDRPWAIGSTNGNAWNAVFVFNGLDRIVKPPAPQSVAAAGAPAAVAHAASATPVAAATTTKIASPAGPLRLFQYSLVGYGTRIGTLLFAALVFGLVAMYPMLRRRLRPPPGATVMQWAGMIAVAVWLLSGYVLFSFAGRVQPRYLEAFTPAIAIALGCSVAVLVRRARDLFGVYVLLATFTIVMFEGAYETASGKHGHLAVAIGALLALPVLLYVLAGFAAGTRRAATPRWYRADLTVLGTFAALLAFPVVRDILLIRAHSGSQAYQPRLGDAIVDPISRYLRAHQGNTRYEFAATAATLAAPFILKDARPVLLLTTVGARPLVTLPQLRRALARGEVRYVFNHGRCLPPVTHHPTLPACSVAMRWVRAHARDVTSEAGLAPGNVGLLYDLRRPPAR